MILLVYFIGIETYLRIFVQRKFWATSVERNQNDKISLLKKRRSSSA